MFGIEARKAIQVATAGIKADVPVTADTKPAIASIEALKARMRALNDRLATLRITAEDKQAEATVAKLQVKMAVLAKTMASLTMSADTKKLDAQILAKIAELKKLQQSMTGLKMDADDKALVAKLSGLERQAFNLKKSLDKGTIKGDINVKAALDKLAALNASIALLKHNAKDVTLVASNVSALRNVAVLKAEIASLQKQARDIRLGGNVDTAALMAAEATLLGLESALGKASDESAVAKTAMNAFFASTGRGSTFAAAGWRLLTGHVTLFGGALNRVLPRMFTSVAVWHLLADAVIELVAVWAPAIIAVTAFGVAGADAAKSIYNRMVAVHTVMDATGRAVPPLTNSFKHLAAAVKPEVYQLFGDALVVMGKRGGAFNTVATETGRVIDQLAARFVLAITSGTGVNKFMENAVNDVRLLGDSIGNLGGIFGAVFRAVPGYAEILLRVGDAITKVLESAAQAAEPVIAVGLALHGFFIYGGAAVTVSLALVASLVKVGAAFGKFNEKITLVGLNNLKKFRDALATGATNVAIYGSGLAGLARSEGAAAAGTRVLADAQRLLTRIPTTVWVLAAATALASLVIAVIRSKDAAQKFNDTLQETIQNAPLASVITTIQQAQVVTAARLADSTRKLNTAIKENTVVNAGRAGALNSNGTAIQNLDNASRHYAEGLGQLTDQQKLVIGRFGELSKAYHGNTAALGILNAAGITTAQITDTNKDHWAQARIQVDATAQAYALMGTQAGVLGNDLDVLGRTVTDQAQAIKKLNDAWGQFIGDVTGTQGAFDTVAQGFFTLRDHAGKLTFSLGKLKIKYADQKAAIDALTPAGIALNQAFSEQVVNIDKLFASWRTAGLAANLFTAGVRAAIAPLVKYAAGSKEATAQLVALAQEAGYQGPISMKALTKWLGNTHGATQKLKDITNQATLQEALLTGAMRAQGSYLAGTLIGDINNAILKYNHVEQAAAAYGNAIAKSGRQSDAAKRARDVLIKDLIRSGTAAGDSKQQIAAMIAKVLGIPPKKALQIVMTGTGSFSLSQINAKTGKQQQAATGGYINMAGRLMRAAGGYIDMGSGPVADDVPIMASKGEYVVKASSVAKYGKPAMDRINAGAYASGGLVSHGGNPAYNGDLSVLTGQYAVNKFAAFQAAMTKSMTSAMRSALKAAIAAAQAAAASAGGFGTAGPGGGAPAANAALARRMMPAWGSGAEWNAWNYLEMREAGWNQFARNPSSGAYGIPQALPPGKMGPAANPPQSNPAAQISWMIGYIKSRYRDPINAANHERNFNWYKHGGMVSGFASGGTVGQQGAAYLHAWRSRHGGGFGAAHGPVVLNEQISRMSAAYGRASTLSRAGGLSAGQHRFWARAAADEKKRLAVLRRELSTERAWRFQLELGELGLDKQIRAAGNLPALRGPVRGWKAELARDKAKVTAISRMLGYSNAYLAAHKPPRKTVPPGVPGSIPHTGVFTDRTADLIAQLFASLASNSRVVTLNSGGAGPGGVVMDRGGWLQPGWNPPMYNGTGRPERVGDPGGTTIILQNHGVIGSQAQLRDWLARAVDDLKRMRRI